MKKIILVDGNNLLFRSYYATAYSGNFMKNKEGFPTNALYGFVNMINKIINDEKTEYMLVAFDKGKTFRHEKYEDYKAGRIEMPNELKQQFPVAKELLDYLGIKHFEIDNYEADDIIGTLSKMVLEDDSFNGLIVSSDKDLLQLINEQVTVKLLKSKDYIMMDEKMFYETYGLKPDKMVDIKSLQGDASDNIPGVKGIGEKTALKLLVEYGSLEGVYDNINEIKGSVQTKLINGRDDAFKSYDLATIYKEVPLGFSLEDTKLTDGNLSELKSLYEKLEFYSFLKNMKISKNNNNLEFKKISDVEELNVLKDDISIYLEIDNSNYHLANILALGICDGKNLFYVKKELISDAIKKINDKNKFTYDLKKTYVSLKHIGVNLQNVSFDSMIAAYLLNYNVKDDIAYLANQFGYDVPFYEIITKSKEITEDTLVKLVTLKAKFIYDTKPSLEEEMEKEGCTKLFNDLEMPLSIILGDMEYEGIRVNKDVLLDMNLELDKKLKELSLEIYKEAGEEFNISSPRQLGEILFAKLEIGKGKKTKSGYSTDKAILEKYKDRHPIVPLVLEYRMLSKLQSTYTTGLIQNILSDGKIHTIYTQTLTRTGRLSSIEPNLQNIPARIEYGKLIRKAFVPEDNSVLLSSDYSQIELRVFAHFSKVPNLISAFKNDMDIHTQTAMDIFDVKKEDVTKEMRRQAKAVNFGILYGISSYGLSTDIGISVKEAKAFIEKYFEAYSGTKIYMDSVIKKAYEDGYVTTIMNRKRKIEELKNTNYMIRQQGERMALNTPIQGSSADILKKAMIDIYNEFKKKNIKSKMILQVHDELIFNVLKEEVDIVKQIVRDSMDNAFKLDVPLKVDIQTGSNWYELK